MSVVVDTEVSVVVESVVVDEIGVCNNSNCCIHGSSSRNHSSRYRHFSSRSDQSFQLSLTEVSVVVDIEVIDDVGV